MITHPHFRYLGGSGHQTPWGLSQHSKVQVIPKDSLASKLKSYLGSTRIWEHHSHRPHLKGGDVSSELVFHYLDKISKGSHTEGASQGGPGLVPLDYLR